MASVCGVPRVMNSASTLRSVISLRAFSAASLGSKRSSSVTTSMRRPLMPPAALVASKNSFAPSMFSFTPAATGPLTPVVCPISRFCASATPASGAADNSRSRERQRFTIREPRAQGSNPQA